jgi:hypothetical protein
MRGSFLILLLPSLLLAAEPAPRETGYRGIWYMNQPQNDEFKYKYSGGFATYPQQHIPLAIYSKAADKTFFVFGGAGATDRELRNCVSYFDHATGTVPRPVIVQTRKTDDAHFNPTLSIDDAGHVYVFANSHGVGTPSYVYRSAAPHSIDAFEKAYEGNFSYSQPWNVEGRGILWLHTRYEAGKRRLYFVTSDDGKAWSEPKPLARIRSGDYQVSTASGQRVATAFDHHPDKGGLNARTNIYYVATDDFGQTWRTAAGEAVALPVVHQANPALVRDYEKEGLLVYLKDVRLDAEGRPVILYLTTKGYASGPAAGPRTWHTARWDGKGWDVRVVATSDHNYDHGSLYLMGETWRVIAPLDAGPQAHTTGGGIVVLESKDLGQTWERVRFASPETGRNHTYVRQPRDAHDGFHAFWADGSSLGRSASDLYFMTRDLTVFRLPREMEGDVMRPAEVRQ